MQNKIYQGSCFDLINRMEDNSIDLIVTSPPYADVKSYGKNINVLHPDNYNEWILPLFTSSFDKLKPSGSFIVNIGDKVLKKIRHTYALDLPGVVIGGSKLKFYDRYFWHNSGLPNGSKKRVNNFTEFIYHFVKDEDKVKWNMDSVREKYKESTITRLKKSICKYEINERGEKILAHKRKCELNPIGKTPDGMFKFPNNGKTRGNKHPAPFSIELPGWFIRALTDEDDVVLDPFMGSGTTAEAAIKLNRQWIGFELNEEYVKMANDRVMNKGIFQ